MDAPDVPELADKLGDKLVHPEGHEAAGHAGGAVGHIHSGIRGLFDKVKAAPTWVKIGIVLVVVAIILFVWQPWASLSSGGGTATPETSGGGGGGGSPATTPVTPPGTTTTNPQPPSSPAPGPAGTDPGPGDNTPPPGGHTGGSAPESGGGTTTSVGTAPASTVKSPATKAPATGNQALAVKAASKNDPVTRAQAVKAGGVSMLVKHPQIASDAAQVIPGLAPQVKAAQTDVKNGVIPGQKSATIGSGSAHKTGGAGIRAAVQGAPTKAGAAKKAVQGRATAYKSNPVQPKATAAKKSAGTKKATAKKAAIKKPLKTAAKKK